MCANTLIKNRLLKPKLIANKKVQQRLYATIKMGIFYIVSTGIIEQDFQCTAKVILLAND